MWTILRRAAGAGMGLKRLTAVLFLFSSFTAIEGLHPLQGGIFRLKYRTRPAADDAAASRCGRSIRNTLAEIVTKHVGYLRRWLHGRGDAQANRARSGAPLLHRSGADAE